MKITVLKLSSGERKNNEKMGANSADRQFTFKIFNVEC